MDRQDVSRVARRIRSFMQDKNYKEVVKLAKSLRLDRINNGLLILDVVEAYEKLGEKKEAKNTLLNYYDVHGITGRNMMQKLIELCIETRDISNAVGLCMEFENEWPESSISYLMRYQITTSAGGNLEERIHYLEKYKETEFEERWGYELAKLYDKNNQPEQCAAVCHEIICFFGHGKYVEKAVQLKERVAGLTDDELDILDAVKRREEEARLKREEEERLAREEAERLKHEEELRRKKEEERRREREERQREERQREREQSEADPNREGREFFAEAKEDAEPKKNRAAQMFAPEESYGEENISANADFQEDDENTALKKAYEAKTEKIRQTEEAARLLKAKREEERMAREQKIAQVLQTSDRYAEVEKNKAEGIYFEELSREPVNPAAKQKRNSSGGGLFSSFGKMASDIRKTLQPDEEYLEDAEGEIEYITVGLDSQAYAQDIEEQMISELDMLGDEQIAELTSEQIKELYELKIFRRVRENIKQLIDDMDRVYHTTTSEEELKKFVETDPYPSLVMQNNHLEVMDGEQETVEKTISEDSEGEREIVEKEPGSLKKAELEVSGEKAGEAEEEKTEEPEEELSDRKETEVEEPADVEETELEVSEEEPADVEEVELEVSEVEEPADVEEAELEVSEKESAGFEKAGWKASKEDAAEAGDVEDTAEAKDAESETKGEDGTADKVERKDNGRAAISGEQPADENSEEEVVPEKTETILDRIEDPEENLTIKEFSECITAYAGTKGYSIEDTAYMTIAVLAEEMQQHGTALSLNHAKKMADDAIAKIQKRSPLDKIMDRYSKKRAYLLKDRHFYWKPEKKKKEETVIETEGKATEKSEGSGKKEEGENN